MIFIKMLVFWLSMVGYGTFLNTKYKIKPILTLPLVIAMIACLEVMAGLLNIMVITTIIIYITGLSLLFRHFWKNKNNGFDYFKDSNMIFLFLIIIYISVVFSTMHLEHYDNYSHWAVIVQEMFKKNGLPNFENTIIEFQAYQPGTASFIYFFGFLVGKTEGVMIVAQNVIFVVFLTSLLAVIKDKYKIIFKTLFLAMMLYMLVGNVPFSDLLVDVTLSVVALSSFIYAFEYHKDLKKLFIIFIPITIFLFLIKNSGIIFAAINCTILLLLALIYNKKHWKKAFYLGFIIIGCLYVWQQHVVYAYGIQALNAHHAMSMQNFIASLQMKGMGVIFDFFSVYIKHFFDISNNICNFIIIIINLIVMSLLLFFKQQRKLIGKALLVIDSIYLCYYAFLGAMYLLSMSAIGALGLAGFDRYMYTIIFLIIGLVIAFFIYLSNINTKKYVTYSYSIVFICLLLFMTFGYKKTDYKVFLGEQNYEQSVMYKMNQITRQLNEKIKSNDIVYFVYPILDESGYIRYMARYEFDHDYMVVINDLNKISVTTENTYIIFYNTDDELFTNFNSDGYIKISDNIYKSN